MLDILVVNPYQSMEVIRRNGNKMNYKNKNIIVIGGSSGIGRGIASSYIDKGANVCITGTRDSINDYYEEKSENIKKELSKKILTKAAVYEAETKVKNFKPYKGKGTFTD